ncbi:MAG: molybdopterin-dependent oxidoreductase [Roseobacter sp.]
MSLTATTCPYCGVGCGVLADASGTVKGDPKHPANFGRLCSKGAALGETIDLDGRLLEPKVGGAPTTWDRALDLTAQRFSQAIKEHGPDSVAFYVSGQLLTEDYYVANKLMKGYIGSANIDTNSRLCMASSVAGHKRAFGTDTVPGTYADLEEADLIVLVGSNLAWCHPVLHQRIAAAKAQRPGLKIVNIDPRRTATSELADMHLQISPNGDIALFNGLLAHLADTRKLDLGYIQSHVNGCHNSVMTARETDALQSGLTPQDLQAFYRLWAETDKVVTVYSQGVNQSQFGTDTVGAILNCHLGTGRIGKPGCGPFSVTGQPNAMGGREVGGLANMLANHLEIENQDHSDTVQTYWQSPTICTTPGLKAVDLFQACADGKIKALWIMSTNPAVSMPDADHVASSIANVPFVVVSDIMERTDTGDLADVLLPATGWGEKNGTVTNSERRVSRQRAFLPAPGQARPDWKIICDVAARMGWGEAFDYVTPSEVFAEYVGLSSVARPLARDLDLSVFETANYESLAPTQWPQNDHRFFAAGRFYHPDGRARMLPIAAPQLRRPTFNLNTGRNRDQWHTMTRTGKAPRLGAHLAEPYVEIHPTDATALDVAAGDLIQLDTIYGRSILRALITARVAPGQLFAPMHWTRQRASAGTINRLTPPVTDPISGQPALKDISVVPQLFKPAWFGFVASVNQMIPQHDYAAVARTQTGWQAEIAHGSAPKDWVSTAAQLTNMNPSDAAVFHDAASGAVRVAFSTDGIVQALFFAAPGPVVLSRTQAIAQIGGQAAALAALAGNPAQGQLEAGPTVCACFNVGKNTLLKAVSDGANTLDALSAATCAGTNCGSCKPELTALLHQLTLPVAAE